MKENLVLSFLRSCGCFGAVEQLSLPDGDCCFEKSLASAIRVIIMKPKNKTVKSIKLVKIILRLLLSSISLQAPAFQIGTEIFPKRKD